MMMKAWQSFFDIHSERYDENNFTSATAAEASFLFEMLPKDTFTRVVDIGCGTGRHSIALTEMGYCMTGVDISEGMLAKAKAKAGAKGFDIRFLQADATGGFPDELGLAGAFDAALCLCEGSLGLIGTGEDPIAQATSIFGNAEKLLRPKGKFILTALSALRIIRQYGNTDVKEGRFDPINLVEWHTLNEVDPDIKGDLAAALIGEKAFTGCELRLLLEKCGFRVDHMWGGTAGSWGMRALDPDEYEIMVVASKA
jgi:SAM-dependent methyltransferase